jgi:capsular exopolysaccharide synthesis family protein
MISHNENNNTVGETNSYAEMPRAGGIMPESLIEIVWRSRWIVLAATVIALGAAFVYLSKATPIYTSTSRIYVEQTGPKIIGETAEGVMTQSKNYLYTQAELLKSTPILAAALEVPGIKQLKTFSRVDNPIAYLKKKLDASVGKKDDLISMSFDSPYPTEAAQLVNAVVDSYVTYQATTKRSTSAEVLKILQNEKTKRGQEFSEKLKAMMDFKKENMTLAFEGKQGNVILQRLERLSMILTEAQLATIESQSIYESTKKMISDPIGLKQFIEAQRAKGIYVSTETERAQLESKVEELERRGADRLRQLTLDHPAVIAIATEIVQIKKQITRLDQEFAKAQLAVAEQQYLAAKAKEEQVAQHFEEQRQQAVALNEQLAQYTILQSEWEQTKKLCDILDDRIKELNVTEDVGALNISILEVARPADKPSKPQKARYMAISLLLGLMLGGGVALLRDWMDQRLRSAEEISAVLGVPMLGVVPSMSRKLSVVMRGKILDLESTSSSAEAYRTIRTAVFFSVPKGEAKTVLITSPGAGDGKTTLVSNLGIAMAQAGQQVLILDADFRKPMQHSIFEVAKEPGLSSIIAGQETLNKAIRRTSVKGLNILPCGPDVANPSEILNSSTFADIMAELSLKYDRILVDSPPVMPVTDACILGAICDVTLLVIRAEKSTRKSAQQARDGLLSVGAHILGAIVNDVPRKKGRYGYYYYGYYGYSYGYGRKEREKGEHKKAVAISAANPGNDIRNG